MRDRKKHRICGILSGIPRCCVQFWITKWSRMDESQRTLYLWPLPDKVLYVPCPKCIAKKHFVDIRLVWDCEKVIPIKCPRRKSCVLWQRGL